MCLPQHMGPESVGIVYSGTPTDSSLRRLIADRIAHLAHDDAKKGIGWMTFIDEYPREALVDALKSTVRIREIKKTIQLDAKSIQSYVHE